MYRDDEQGQRKTYKDNCNSYIAMIRHIHQSHKVHYCFKKYQQLRLGFLVINQTNFMMYPLSLLVLRLTSLRGLGWKKGLHLPCQEKGVRPLALDSKSWISSLQKINMNLNWQEFFCYFLKLCKPLIVSYVCITFLNPPSFPSCLNENI